MDKPKDMSIRVKILIGLVGIFFTLCGAVTTQQLNLRIDTGMLSSAMNSGFLIALGPVIFVLLGIAMLLRKHQEKNIGKQN